MSSKCSESGGGSAVAPAVKLANRSSGRRDSRGVSAGAMTAKRDKLPCSIVGTPTANRAHLPKKLDSTKSKLQKNFSAPTSSTGGKSRGSKSTAGTLDHGTRANAPAVRLLFARAEFDYVKLLADHLRAHGFTAADYLALAVVAQGKEPALSVVLLAFYDALRDAEDEWRRRTAPR